MDLVLPLFEPISNKVLSIGIALIDHCSGQFDTNVGYFGRHLESESGGQKVVAERTQFRLLLVFEMGGSLCPGQGK